MPTILLVDDERAILHSTCMLLEEMGHRVIVTASASEVLPLLRSRRPDLLLQDVRMPGLDLRHLLEQLRAEADLPRVPVVLFSASIDLREVAMEVGVEGILEKPFRPAELARAVETALAGRPLPAPAPMVTPGPAA